jgi:hypothetical protein
MPEDKLIPPQWLMAARKNRKKFISTVVVLFLICTLLAFWALPMMVARSNEVIKESGHGKLPGHIQTVLFVATWFKMFWVAIAIGCGVAIGAALTGKVDGLLPILNIGMMVAAAGAVAFMFYVFYLPAQILVERLK